LPQHSRLVERSPHEGFAGVGIVHLRQQKSDDFVEEVFAHGKRSGVRRATECSWALAVLSEDPNDIKKKRANSDSRIGAAREYQTRRIVGKAFIRATLSGKPSDLSFYKPALCPAQRFAAPRSWRSGRG